MVPPFCSITTGSDGGVKRLFALEIVHPFKLLMHSLELPLNVIALWKGAQGCQCMFKMVLGINQQTTFQAARLVTHRVRESLFI